MAKTENIKLEGTVEETLGNGLFKIAIKMASGETHFVNCRCKGKMNVHNIKILLGDVVDIEVSPTDLSKGFITYRRK